jgi:radical SAM-linked protein
MDNKTAKANQNGNSKEAMRIRVEFAKTEAMRFTSHLDLYRAWERLLRRAGLLLVFSQGYNPRPKIQLAAPLALGITSRTEIIDFWLSDGPADIETINNSLIQAQPPGIEIHQVTFVDPSSPPLQQKVNAAEYQVKVLDEVTDLDQRIASLLEAESVQREKRGKLYDLRPLIQKLTQDLGDNGRNIQIFMRLNAQEGGTGRPEEVLLAMEIQPENTLIERTRLIFQD